MTRSDLQLGMVGLGALGLPIAGNLQRAGFPMRVHTRSRGPENDPTLQGCVSTPTPAETARGVDVLLICVSDDAAVESVLFGPDGAASTLAAGACVVDCSTTSPACAIAAAQRLAQQQVRFLDAPVTGGTEGARDGSLTVLVGGDPEVLARVQPLLQVIGASVHHFGPVGSGQQVKAVNQVLVAGSYAAVAEAMALGEQLGLPMTAVIDALQSGAASSWALSHRARNMLENDYPLGFRLALHHKDLGIALDTADSVDLTLPITQRVHQMEQDLMNRGHGEEDVSALRRWLNDGETSGDHPESSAS